VDELPEHFPLSVSPLQQILIHTVNMEKRETKYCEIVFMRLGAYFRLFCLRNKTSVLMFYRSVWVLVWVRKIQPNAKCQFS